MAERRFENVDNDPSGVHPGGKIMRAVNVSDGERQPPVRGYPEENTGFSSNHCGSCNKYLRRGDRRHSLQGPENIAAFDFFLNQPGTQSQSPINPAAAICHACWCKFLRYNTSISKPSEQSAQAIQLSIPRATYSEQRCVFDCKEFGRFRVPDVVRAQVLRDFRYYIGEGTRVCASHNKCYWTEVPPGSSTLYDSAHIEDMVDLLRQSSSSQQCSVVNFDYIDSLTDDVIQKWTSLTKEQFQDLLGRLKSLQEQEKRHPETALALYLAKLRTGESDERLTDIFAVGSRRTSERLISKARTALCSDFVPVYLGFDNVDRERILEGSTVTARKLFLYESTNTAMLIWDGTYIFIQKSNDYSFQRATYSQQKHRPLLKPMLCVTPSGYIIDIFGPYPANQNDASIMKQILKSKPEVWARIKCGDVFLLDRGFRDVVPYLQQRGIITKIPETIPKGHKQLDTESANRSRLVTKCRYIVEVINGMLKSRFRLFDHVFQNKSLGHFMTDFRIAGALLNAYATEIHSDVGYEEQIAERMVFRLNTPNKLKNHVEDYNLNHRKSQFDKMSADSLEGFPILTEKDLYILALGSYQLKQVRFYYDEHIKSDGRYQIEVSRQTTANNLERYSIDANNPMLIRARIRSRHVNQVKYNVYILVEKHGQGVDAILEYYCTCKNGSRTVGCCAHIMTLIWFLGYANFLQNIRSPSTKHDNIFPILETSSEEETLD